MSNMDAAYKAFLDKWLHLDVSFRADILNGIQNGFDTIEIHQTDEDAKHYVLSNPETQLYAAYNDDNLSAFQFKKLLTAAHDCTKNTGETRLSDVLINAENAVRQCIEEDVLQWMDENVDFDAKFARKNGIDAVLPSYRDMAIRGLEKMADTYNAVNDYPAHEWAKALHKVSVNFTDPSLAESTFASKVARKFVESHTPQHEDAPMKYKAGDVILQMNPIGAITLKQIEDIDSENRVTYYDPIDDEYDWIPKKELDPSIIGVIDGTAPWTIDAEKGVSVRHLPSSVDDLADKYEVNFAGNTRGVFKFKENADAYAVILTHAAVEHGTTPYVINMDKWMKVFNMTPEDVADPDSVVYAATKQAIQDSIDVIRKMGYQCTDLRPLSDDIVAKLETIQSDLSAGINSAKQHQNDAEHVSNSPRSTRRPS